MSLNCKICGSETNLLFTRKVLSKYDGNYYRCINCKFLQVFDHPWLEESYSSAITSLDIGLVNRNLVFAPKVATLIDYCIKAENRTYLDYGGGYGLFVRMMRDKGYNYLRYDKYCENLFAKSFDYDIESNDKRKLDLVTAFEVFEHITDPVTELKLMLTLSDNIFFSTEIQPQMKEDVAKWWYISPEIGQHISFYSRESLALIAKNNDLNFYSDGKYFHLFAKQKVSPVLFKLLTKNKVAGLLWFLKSNKRTLLESDYTKLLQNQRRLNKLI